MVHSLNSDKRSAVLLQIYSQEFNAATGTPVAKCEMVPAYLSSVTYNFPSDGAFTEEVSIVLIIKIGVQRN